MTPLLALPAAYLLGSLPWSLWTGKLKGVDLRTQGSGNLGATNVYRVLGAPLGITVLLLDMAKGVAAVLLARSLGPDALGGALPALAGMAAVAGHIWSPFVGFKGGKGVATGFGMFLALAPGPGLVAILVWFAVLLLGGWVSVASGMAALALPPAVWAHREAMGAGYPWALGIACLLALLVVVRHRPNWVRLARGTEQPIWEKRPETPEGGAPREGGVS